MTKKHNMPILSVICEGTYKYETGSGTNKLAKPADAYEMLKPKFKGLDREQFGVLLLNTKNIAIGYSVISIGSLNASIVHPREVFKIALLKNAASIIVAHNHPSGDPTPSKEDIEVTKRLTEAGEIMGIAIRDHIVLGDRIYLSFRERGLL